MKRKIIGLLVLFSFITACVSIPKETVTLSQTLGSDLKILHNAHRNILEIHFKKIQNDINSFVDDKYAPYVINFVLKNQMEEYKSGNPSLIGTIEKAAKSNGKAESDSVLMEMTEFLKDAHDNIESYRSDLLNPIIAQENAVVLAVNQSYENVIYANSTITGYLKSIRKVKKAQQEALSLVGLGNVDSLITDGLINISKQVEEVVKKAEDIDVKSDDAFKKLEDISNKIKGIINK